MPTGIDMTISRTTRAALAGAAVLFAGTSLSAQAPADATLAPVLSAIKADQAWTLDQQKSICEIAAPPFHEQTRAAAMKRRFESLGLSARIDAVGNVIAERPGVASGPTVVLAGHLDTVFPEGTDVSVKEKDGKLYGPGIGDDCRGLATVLTVAREYQRQKVRTAGTVIFVADVGEEGAGNLRGMHQLFEKEYVGKIDYFISVDDAGLGIASRAVGSHRYHVTYHGPGGHSYGAFGIPNPIHALGRAIAGIADIQVPRTPKTTFNVGVIEGGTSVNSISASGSMDIDMRSESAEELNKVDAKVRAILSQALEAENARWPGEKARLTMTIDTIGIRPTGAQADCAKIVRTAVDAAAALGFKTRTGASSTDANIPISMGIPGIRIGGGGDQAGAHSLGEWYQDTPDSYMGPQWAALIVARLAGVR
ncbi:MAG TPA: M20/M25/M40 family metallo-hydrolase [Gemmatimonadaceae bacterium]|nr:M20/M25/M40 family metallo-hydrolase [Gemmatimonadaceae bacterium]